MDVIVAIVQRRLHVSIGPLSHSLSGEIVLLNIVLTAFFAVQPQAAAQSCGSVAAVPETTQVAWISPRGKRAPNRGVIEVVRVQDLRSWVRDNGANEGRLIQGLGMAPRRGGLAVKKSYKVTIFDVQSGWLCRPIEGGTPGEDRSGVAICESSDAGAVGGHRPGYSGCGYTLDTSSSTRGIDVYRIRWSDASAWGFCVMPLDRFISGA